MDAAKAAAVHDLKASMGLEVQRMDVHGMWTSIF